MKNVLTSKERVDACLKDIDVDRPAIINPTSIATTESCRMLGISFDKVHLDSEAMAALAAVGYDSLGFDSVMPHFSVVQEAAAFGCEIDWGDTHNMPVKKSTMFKDPDDFIMPQGFLKRLPISTVINAIKLLKKKYGDRAYIMGKVMGPWTLSYHLHGIQEFLIKTITEPEIAHGFVNKFKEITIDFAQAQFEAGADAVTVADHITRDLSSPLAYQEFLLPVHKEITNYFFDKTIFLHCCGNTLDRIKMFSQAGFSAFHFDSKNNIQEALNAAGSMKLTGCVNNSDVLLKGISKDVDSQVKEIVNQHIILVSPECAIPLLTKNENLAQIAKSANYYYASKQGGR